MLKSLALWLCRLGLSVTAGFAAAGPISLTVPPLQPEQFLIESIFRCGGNIIVRTSEYGLKTPETRYWKLDESSRVLVPFTIAGMGPVLSVSEDRLHGLIALSDSAGVRLRFVGENPRDIIVSTKYPDRFLVATNGQLAFLVFANRIVVVQPDGSTRSIDSKQLMGKSWSDSLPDKLLATSTELILGFDRGEWGGGCYALPFQPDGTITSGRVLVEQNILGLAWTNRRQVWISTGLSHLILHERALYRYDGSQASLVFERSNRGKHSNSLLVDFPEGVTLDGIDGDVSGSLLIAAGDGGLLMLSPTYELTPLWSGKIDVFYEMPNYSVGSGVQGVVRKANDIYVASRSLGILRFAEQREGKYAPVEQICFRSAGTK